MLGHVLVFASITSFKLLYDFRALETWSREQFTMFKFKGYLFIFPVLGTESRWCPPSHGFSLETVSHCVVHSELSILQPRPGITGVYHCISWRLLPDRNKTGDQWAVCEQPIQDGAQSVTLPHNSNSIRVHKWALPPLHGLQPWLASVTRRSFMPRLRGWCSAASWAHFHSLLSSPSSTRQTRMVSASAPQEKTPHPVSCPKC